MRLTRGTAGARTRMRLETGLSFNVFFNCYSEVGLQVSGMEMDISTGLAVRANGGYCRVHT